MMLEESGLVDLSGVDNDARPMDKEPLRGDEDSDKAVEKLKKLPMPPRKKPRCRHPGVCLPQEFFFSSEMSEIQAVAPGLTGH